MITSPIRIISAVAIPILFTFALPSKARAVEIEIDYTFDTAGFFEQPGSREALRAVCDIYEGLIPDSLARIRPADFFRSSWSANVRRPDTVGFANLGNITIPQDTVILFAGARPLEIAGEAGGTEYTAQGSQAWIDRIIGRGRSGALADPETAFSPWGGMVAFDLSRTWNFATDGPGGQTAATDFVPIALNLVAHILGIGLSDAWDNQISQDTFFGENAISAFGAPVPLSSDLTNWRDDGVCLPPLGHEIGNPLNILSPTVRMFGNPGGIDQQALLDPFICNIGETLKVLTELDTAALEDIGWTIILPERDPGAVPDTPEVDELDLDLDLVISINEDGRRELRINTIEADEYQLQRSTDLVVWENFGGSIFGNGTRRSLFDPTQLVGHKFYRILVTRD